MYGNEDLRKVIGNIGPPINKDVIYWYNSSGFTKLNENALETGTRNSAGGWNNINNHMQKYIDEDLCSIRTTVANKLARGASNSDGIQYFMGANNIPSTTKGAYPIVFIQTLTGKNITTSEYQMNINF